MILVTGGAGFIGHHVVEFLLAKGESLVLIDRLDTSGNLNRLAEIGAVNNSRVRFIYHDLKAPITGLLAEQIGRPDVILHLAAATHVDRSIECPMEFVLDNVVATCNMLDFARRIKPALFVQFSTDEVFGPAPHERRYAEGDRYNSRNPYAATKAGAEELAVAYQNTYGVPVIVTHCMNVIGERQHPEKFVPGTIAKVRDGEIVTIHADPTRKIPGSRFYIHARNVADALSFLLQKGRPGEKYNIVGEREMNNLEMAERIASAIGMPLFHELIDFHGSRPGHDLRYALDGAKMQCLGWEPKDTIETSIRRVVEWSLINPHWLIQSRRNKAA